ncbi:hypothetical protein [Streptomyces hydrogenans]|uniref:hypothetical protein n=1 Tax=Streptomyces hydrogenans TaxID=1873719 RepID=UPI0037F54C2C
MAHSTATLPAPMAGTITMDLFQVDETAGWEQIRDWIGAHQNREADLHLVVPVPVPVSSVLADDVKLLLDAPGLHCTSPSRAEIVGHPGTATVRVTLEITGGAH